MHAAAATIPMLPNRREFLGEAGRAVRLQALPPKVDPAPMGRLRQIWYAIHWISYLTIGCRLDRLIIGECHGRYEKLNWW